MPADYLEWRERVSAFESIAAWRVVYLALSGLTDRPVRVQGVLTEPAFFSILGVTPSIGRSFTIDDGRPRGDRVVIPSNGFWRAPRYFETVGIPMLACRDFTAADTNDRLGVAIASRALARRFWGRTDVVGERLRVLFPPSDAFWVPRAIRRPLTIVGVVGDVSEEGMGPIQRENDPQLYLPYAQSPTRIMTLAVRASGPPQIVTPTWWVRQTRRGGGTLSPFPIDRSLIG